MGGERRERRTVIMAVAMVAWEDQSGTARELAVTIEDTSRSGACIRITVPIDVEAKLIVEWRDGRFSGVAKYCRADGNEYSVGIRRDPFQDAVPARVSAQVGTAGGQPSASRNVQEARAGPEQIVKALPTRNAPEKAAMLSAVTRRDAAQGDRVDYKTKSKSDLQVSDVTERDMARFAERQTDQSSHRQERSPMLSKWLHLAPKHDRKNVPNGNSNGGRGPDHGGSAQAELQNDVYAIPNLKGPGIPLGDLLPLEDIYRATGILEARSGYNVVKVVEMLDSSHIRDLPNDMRRASVLMALDAAGISVDEILKDAKLRLDALSSYEADQGKRLEECESRKVQENAGIQLEMERVTEHYLERINRNLDEVASIRDPFVAWQKMKQQEVQRISDAVGLCEKRADSERPGAAPSPSQSELRATVASPEPSGLAAKHGPPAASNGRGQGDGRTLDA